MAVICMLLQQHSTCPVHPVTEPASYTCMAWACQVDVDVESRVISCCFVIVQVDVRLGHMTATTIAQALRQRNLGLSIELNSISNLVTSAVKHAGHLPILKVTVQACFNAFLRLADSNCQYIMRFSAMPPLLMGLVSHLKCSSSFVLKMCVLCRL